jgi:hypothetical protein
MFILRKGPKGEFSEMKLDLELIFGPGVSIQVMDGNNIIATV